MTFTNLAVERWWHREMLRPPPTGEGWDRFITFMATNNVTNEEQPDFQALWRMYSAGVETGKHVLRNKLRGLLGLPWER